MICYMHVFPDLLLCVEMMDSNNPKLQSNPLYGANGFPRLRKTDGIRGIGILERN